MALGTSFTLQGSKPTTSTPSYGGLFGGTPQGNALVNATSAKPTQSMLVGGLATPKPAQSAPQSPAKPVSLTGGASASSLFNNPTSYGGLLGSAPALPTPSTPVKSHTVTDPSGSTITQTYHAPVATNTGGSSNPTSTNSGLINPRVQAANDQIASNGGVSANVVGTPIESVGANNVSNGSSFSGLIDALGRKASDGNALVESANQNLSDFRTKVGQQDAGIIGSGADLNFKTGEEGALQRLSAIKEQALQASVTNALTANSQNLGALGTAAGLLSPVQVPYSNQFIDPKTGQPIGGGAAGQLPPSAQTAVNTYAEQVRNGTMTREDAESRLGAYGVVGINALTQALGSNFNTNASNASAKTTQQGQQLQTAASATNQALSTLQQLYNNLPTSSTTGIPLINAAGNYIEKMLGSSALTTYKQTLADARAQLQGVLTASGAATPTGAESAALTYLPDNMTPPQLKEAIANVQNLIQQKVNSFTNSGSQNPVNQNATSNNIYNW